MGDLVVPRWDKLDVSDSVKWIVKGDMSSWEMLDLMISDSSLKELADTYQILDDLRKKTPKTFRLLFENRELYAEGDLPKFNTQVQFFENEEKNI